MGCPNLLVNFQDKEINKQCGIDGDVRLQYMDDDFKNEIMNFLSTPNV